MALGGDGEQRGIVEDCPVCRRTIWTGSRCYHGNPPPPAVGGPYVDEDEPKVLGEYKTKTRDRRRYGS